MLDPRYWFQSIRFGILSLIAYFLGKTQFREPIMSQWVEKPCLPHAFIVTFHSWLNFVRRQRLYNTFNGYIFRYIFLKSWTVSTPKGVGSIKKSERTPMSQPKRRVTFGRQLTPEIFDFRRPPKTPISKGATPLGHEKSARRSIIKESVFKMTKTNTKVRPALLKWYFSLP